MIIIISSGLNALGLLSVVRAVLVYEFEDMPVVILVKQLLGVGLFCPDDVVHGFDIFGFFLVGEGTAGARGKFLFSGVVLSLRADPRPSVDLQQGKMIAVSHDIAAHEDSRIVCKPEQIGKSGKNVDGGTRLIHNDGFLHGCAQKDKAVQVKVKIIADINKYILIRFLILISLK